MECEQGWIICVMAGGGLTREKRGNLEVSVHEQLEAPASLLAELDLAVSSPGDLSPTSHSLILWPWPPWISTKVASWPLKVIEYILENCTLSYVTEKHFLNRGFGRSLTQFSGLLCECRNAFWNLKAVSFFKRIQKSIFPDVWIKESFEVIFRDNYWIWWLFQKFFEWNSGSARGQIKGKEFLKTKKDWVVLHVMLLLNHLKNDVSIIYG